MYNIYIDNRIFMILEKWNCTEVQAHCVQRGASTFSRHIRVVRAALHSMYTFVYFSTHVIKELFTESSSYRKNIIAVVC